MRSWTIFSSSPRQTRSCGARLGKHLQGGEIIGLVGELGSGKTCLVRGVAEGLDVLREAWIRSPTFTLINEYDGRLPIYHIDLYRIGTPDQLAGLNLREYLYSDGVCLIEWFDHLPSGEVDEFLEVKFVHAGGNKRELTFGAHGERYERILEALQLETQPGRGRKQNFER
jgi:tRNA threonylcarbamoyladenosine biosynthesis protein TsaE